MRSLVLVIFCISYINQGSFASIQDAYILPGDKIIFKINTVKSVSWFWQQNIGESWQKVSGKNVYAHETNQGLLFAAVLQGNNKVSFTDTIRFVEPHANAGTGCLYNGRFYKSVVLNGVTWMAEDLADSTFTYDEAVEIANNIPGWKLPVELTVNTYTAINPLVTSSAYLNLWMKRWNTVRGLDLFHDSMALNTNNHELWLGQKTGFNAVPNIYDESRYAEDFEKYGAYYWFYQGRNPIYVEMLSVPNTTYPFGTNLHWKGVKNNDMYNVTRAESAIRLVKDAPIENVPPDETKPLWPFNGLEGVSRTPTLTWMPVSDPDGDKVIYTVSLHQPFGQNKDHRRYITDTNSFTITDPLPEGVYYEWRVYTQDEHGFMTTIDQNSGIYHEFEFKVARSGENQKTNPGDYGIQKLNVLQPQNGDNIYNNRVRVEWEEFTSKTHYQIFLSKENPPSFSSFERVGRTRHISDILEPETDYHLMIKAIDGREIVAESDIISFRTLVASEGVTTVDVEDDDNGDEKSEPKVYSAGTGANTTISDFFEIYPVNGSVSCINNGRADDPDFEFLKFELKTRIREEGEFRLYIRSVKRTQTQGWQVFKLRYSDRHPDGIRRVGSHIDLANLSANDLNSEMEWKVVFYDPQLKKESKASEVFKFTLQEPKEYKFEYINANESSERISWSAVEGATGYTLNFKEKYRDCYECRTLIGCMKSRYFSDNTSETSFSMPAANTYTDYYEVEIIPTGNACFVKKGSFKEGVETFHNQLPPTCPQETYKKVEDNKDNDGDGSPTSGGSGSGTKIYSNTPILVTYKTSAGNWKAVGPLQNVSANPDEDYVIDLALYRCHKGTHKFYKSCGKFNIYTLDVCDMGISEEARDKAINRVHSFLINNGCSLY